jgi:hypothetical protein
MSWSERINTASSGSGRVDDIKGHLQGEIRGPTKLVKMRGRDEMDRQPEGRECGMQSSQWSPRKRCDIDNAKRWAQPESREDRVNHFARGLDAIRDSRIALQDGFRDTP